MATMVKEKRRDKKRSKDKHSPKKDITAMEPTCSSLSSTPVNVDITETIIPGNMKTSADEEIIACGDSETDTYFDEVLNYNDIASSTSEQAVCANEVPKVKETISPSTLDTKNDIKVSTLTITESLKPLRDEYPGKTYEDMNLKLERIAIPSQNLDTKSINQELALDNPAANLQTNFLPLTSQVLGDKLPEQSLMNEEESIPSAPMLEFYEVEEPQPTQEPTCLVVKEAKPKLQCMSLEQAELMYGGEEMAEVQMLSEREELLVQGGPLSGPEHPLVDLLSTLRQSHICLERDRVQLFQSFKEEEKFRSALWKVEKRTLCLSDKCPCGETVYFKGKYEHAEFLKEKLSVARMKLTVLLRDIQESYCHHQHSALLAFYQIEEFLVEVIKGNKNDIREALSLILQALKLSDNAPPVLAKLLERWAVALSAALVDGRDLRQLLFLIHHLFRQTRSVSWAAHVVSLHVGDHASAARALAVLQLVLARPAFEPALECTEESDEAWEEVDVRGGGGAVGDGALREGDLLLLLRAMPLRQLVANLVLFTHNDISYAREHEWSDRWNGRGVLKACCGVRALLAVLQRAVHVHASYTRLHAALRDVAVRALHALAGLHMHTRLSYAPELRATLSAELCACFLSGLQLLGGRDLHRLPAALLDDRAGKDYCIDIIFGLHTENKSPRQLDSLPANLPALACAEGIRIISQAAIDRRHDHELARLVLEYLLQIGFKKKSVTCKGGCENMSRELLPRLLDTHVYLYTIALHLIADMNQGETLDPAGMKYICMSKWKPTNGEVRAVLDDWAQRCPNMLQHLLLQLDYTPHVGLSLESQLSIGAWLCSWWRALPAGGEWSWLVMRRLRLHRACWRLPLDAPDPVPEPAPADLLAAMYALRSSSWGHSVPLICSVGASALCRVCASRPADGVLCLAPIMVAMAASPDSFDHAEKFEELFNILLSTGPGLVQRALRLGGASGPQLLQRLILQHLGDYSPCQLDRPTMLSVWLHALWRGQLSAAAAALLDTALVAARCWRLADGHSARRVQECSREQISMWCKHASCAPQLVECILRALHTTYEQRAGLAGQLLDALHHQRTAKVKVNVDGALQQMGVSFRSDELVIHRASGAALAAPLDHPATLQLWRLFMTLYLQRPPCNTADSTAPVGPLFFSGILKSRTLSTIKKRLYETSIYHQNAAKAIKEKQIEPKPTTSIIATPRESKTEVISNTNDDDMLSGLSIIDFTGESSDSDSNSASEEEIEEERETETTAICDTDKQAVDMYNYHVSAEKLIRTYAVWLDEGEKVRASPHHADISKFMSDQALTAAWRSVVSQRRCTIEADPLPLPEPPPPPKKTLPTVFETVVDTILGIKDRSRRRKSGVDLKPVVGDLDVSDARVLLNLLDKYMQDLEKYARQWRAEVTRITSLDSQLWNLVGALRVSKQLLVQHVVCSKKCKPVLLTTQTREWCLSLGAVNGIVENRSFARAAVRRLSRPSRAAVRAAVALLALARSVRSAAAARRAAERAWRAAVACDGCLPAHDALKTMLDELAQRWICNNGSLCAELVSAWSLGECVLQQALCGALVAPRRLPAADWPLVYTALLRQDLPAHRAFSYLSKFEVSRWAEAAKPEARRTMLEALAAAITRHGAEPETTHHVLLELLGVHVSSLLDSTELCPYVVSCARQSAAGRLPPQHWPHVVRAADRCAALLPVDQLGHLLRELGATWWEARGSDRGPLTALYASHTAALLRTLHRAFVASTIALSYAPERVCVYAWSGARESWSPWLQPAAAPMLLPAAALDDMLAAFGDTLLQTMADCPGIEEPLLGEVWQWAVGTYLSVANLSSEWREPTWSLLRALARLPFTHYQWLRDSHLHAALQICRSPDSEVTSWCGATLAGLTADTMIGGERDEQLAPRLAALFCLFTAPAVQYDKQTLEEACRLPWWRLPAMALDEGLERFFVEHYNVLQPYHESIHFRVVVSACELGPRAAAVRSCAAARDKRARGVSTWQRAACSPHLLPHVPAHCHALLSLLAELTPHLEESEGELEELLSRAVVIMCIESAATGALPVWEKWVCRSSLRARRACATAVCALTVYEPFAALADVTARALLQHRDGAGWSDVSVRWSRCHWREASGLASRARLHAAYGTALAQPQSMATLRTTFMALLAADINFVENEIIVSVWICFACRVARTCVADGADEGEALECSNAAAALLARWAEPARRSLLQLVGVQQASLAPTAQHRVLCNLAQCILSPGSESAVRAFDAACVAAGGPAADAAPWARDPRPKTLPRLAIRMYPAAENYFKDELHFAPED